MTIELGTTVNGTVIKVADYGAIVRLPGGKTGLVHISEIADVYVRDVRDYLNEDDVVAVKVLRLNDKGRYELSVKQAGADLPVREQQPQVAMAGAARPGRESRSWSGDRAARGPDYAVSFEDRLSRFMKDSQERQSDLKRNMESKRGRR